MIRLERGGASEWSFGDVAEKLRLRDGLPGAYAFDRAAEALARAEANGNKRASLLPLVFASSWFVNNPVPSTVFRKWLSRPLLDVWVELANVFEGGSQLWLDFEDAERDMLATGIRTLAIDGHGAGAISKPLALLAPNAVPLMPDAAIAFALGAVAVPSAPDAQTASIDVFAPMMTWFAKSVASAQAELAEIAERHALATGVRLSPAQVLDRVLWFDSVGYRHFRSKAGAWWWVRDEGREAIIHFDAPPPPDAKPEGGPIDLGRSDLSDDWRAKARAVFPSP
jgi:hypothetical protein